MALMSYKSTFIQTQKLGLSLNKNSRFYEHWKSRAANGEVYFTMQKYYCYSDK